MIFPAPFRRLAALLFVGLAALLPHSAHAWWDDQWSLRKKITIDTTAAGVPITDSIGPAAVLLRLHDGNFQFSAAKSDGTDLRFVNADDKTPLPYHIEKYDSLLNEAFVWVKVPDLKPGEAHAIWLYYGNSAAPAAADSKATYDADTVLVWHFGEHGQAPRDFSGNGNDGGGTVTASDGALIAGGVRFDGKGGITVPGTPSLAWTDGGATTLSAWIKPATVGSDVVVFARRDAGRALVLGIDHGVPYADIHDASGDHRTPAGKPVLAGQWQHWAVTASGAELKLYIGGQLYGTVSARLPALATAATLGADASDGSGNPFSGEMDEFDVSKVVRSAGAIAFAAISQGGDQAGKLIVMGEDEPHANWLSFLKTGTVGILINSLTLDGWVVIGLLFIMGCISWAIMVRKGMYLNATARSNVLFMKEWRHLSADLTALDHGEPEKAKTMGGRIRDTKGLRAMRQASAYRIYHIGAEEIRHRLESQKQAAPKFLSARSMQAIKASLDTGMVHENHRLNSGLVMLTIAISGGPFLGLLGTVVGVMITFAAIAAAGDVNVNAIAPGIAAALVATVAGLAVAIPALFGYNYLLARVKNATSDMQVFVDEFIAKMAEFYQEPGR